MYEVYYDDVLLYKNGIEELAIVNATVDLELNKVGSFEFTIYPNHPLYSNITQMKKIITIFQDNTIIFRGRILDITLGFNNSKKVNVEGELAFLNDTIVRPFEKNGTDINTLFNMLLKQHNDNVDEEKQILFGNSNVTSDSISVELTSYDTTWNVIFDLIIDKYGGYIVPRHVIENEKIMTYLDYIDYDIESEINYCTQTIEFGKNLVDFKKELKGEDLFSCLIPLGNEVSVGDSKSSKVNIASVNNGKDYILNDELVSKYGRIFKTVELDTTDSNLLLALGTNYLNNATSESSTIELSAVDLSKTDKSIESFSIGEFVNVRSKFHKVDDAFLVSKLTINLLNHSQSKITLGSVIQTFTEQSANNNINNSLGSLNTKLSQIDFTLKESFKLGSSITPTLNSYWSNASGYEQVSYYKDSFGVVYITGTITGGGAGDSDIFTLNEGYRPKAKQMFVTQKNITVDTNGIVAVSGMLASGIITLSGISFRMV